MGSKLNWKILGDFENEFEFNQFKKKITNRNLKSVDHILPDA